MLDPLPLIPKAFPAASSGAARRFRGFLPHLESPHCTYFVTFRLADSLPFEMQERLRITAESGNPKRVAAASTSIRPTARQIEEALDRGTGGCHLQIPEIAAMVAASLQHFDGDRYLLYAWCVMPNHVHAIVEPVNDLKLSRILHSWKSFTAHRANSMLHQTGEFWQREYFDRLLRDEREFLRALEYVLQNPVKAGLTDWPWVGYKAISRATP